MLLRFSVTNYKSFREEQTLLMTASSLRDADRGLLQSKWLPGEKILPSVVVFGANASGKSNLLHAFVDMVREIVSSSRTRGPESRISFEKFALDTYSQSHITKFEIDFISKSGRYRYGFNASEIIFEKEWLYAFPKGTRQLLFQRDDDTYKFGRSLKGRNKTISELTRNNSLFLSAAIQNNHTQLRDIGAFFRSMLINFAGEEAFDTAVDFPETRELDPRVLQLLEQLDTGVVGSRLRKQSYRNKDNEFDTAISEALKNAGAVGHELFDHKAGEEKSILELAHSGESGERFYLNKNYESSGTKRLTVLLPQIFDALDHGRTLVVDELSTSLHPAASRQLLAMFMDPEVNRSNAQLIATTHDINLLSEENLRRDQVWFTEKNEFGTSHLYPLTDIRTRKGDNIRKGYVQGRYGAYPLSDHQPLTDM